MGRTQDAEDTWRALLEQNPDNLEYYRGFLRTKGYDISEFANTQLSRKVINFLAKSLSPEAISKVLSSLDAFSESYPRSTAPKRLALDIAQGECHRRTAKELTDIRRRIPE